MTDDLQAFATAFTGNGIVGRLVYYPTVDSTNDTARELLRSGPAPGTIILADQQTKGRGRSGRSWISPPGSGLWMSLILQPALPPDRFFVLNLACSLAVARTIKHITPDVWLKWPNDILIGQRKVSGILMETCQANGEWYVIAGIGININQQTFPEDLATSAISLRQATAVAHNRLKILSLLMENLGQTMAMPHPSIIDEWTSRCCLWNRKVTIRQNNEDYAAEAVGLAEDGGLMVRDGKETKVIYAADVSLRL